jgi:hypothetical protein
MATEHAPMRMQNVDPAPWRLHGSRSVGADPPCPGVRVSCPCRAAWSLELRGA